MIIAKKITSFKACYTLAKKRKEKYFTNRNEVLQLWLHLSSHCAVMTTTNNTPSDGFSFFKTWKNRASPKLRAQLQNSLLEPTRNQTNCDIHNSFLLAQKRQQEKTLNRITGIEQRDKRYILLRLVDPGMSISPLFLNRPVRKMSSVNLWLLSSFFMSSLSFWNFILSSNNFFLMLLKEQFSFSLALAIIR